MFKRKNDDLSILKRSLRPLKMFFNFTFIPLIITMGVGGVVFFLSDRSNRNKCTEDVTAEIVDFTEHSDPSTGSGGQDYQTAYTPVFEYFYKDQKYLTKNTLSSDQPKYSIGENVKLKIDPDDPETIYDPNDKWNIIPGYIYCGISTVLLIVYIIIMSAIRKAIRRAVGYETESDDYDEDYDNDYDDDQYDEDQ